MNSPFSLLKGFFEGGREEPAADAGTEACRSFEEGYDAVEQEYLSVLEILKAGEGDPAGLSRALSEAEQRLSEELERLETKADEIEARVAAFGGAHGREAGVFEQHLQQRADGLVVFDDGYGRGGIHESLLCGTPIL